MSGIDSSESPRYGHPGPYLAVVTHNQDPTFMGALEVMLLEGTTPDSDVNKQTGTITVRYLPSFFGYTNQKWEGNDSSKFNDVQKSYGMWMIPPDLGTVVVVMFIGGDKNSGYWLGCVPDKFQNHMVPGIAASKFVAMTPEQERKYGTKNLPVAEFSKRNRDLSNPKRDEYTKPIHPFADRLLAQGLLADDIRGISSSSARREHPSSVYGISTPGPVDASVNAPKQELGYNSGKLVTFVSRLGGHQIVMDDGQLLKDPKTGIGKITNELFRIRTRTGHQILLHNSSDLIYIANAAGTAWLEMTAQGKIDIYAADSVSIHAEGDFNLRADRDFNIEALRDVNINAGGNIKQQTKGNWSVDGARECLMSFDGTYNLHSRSAVIGIDDTLGINAGTSITMNSSISTSLLSSFITVQSKNEMSIKATQLKMEGTTQASVRAADIKFSATKSLGVRGDVDLRLTSPSLNINGAIAQPAPVASSAATTVRAPTEPTALPIYSLPNRDIDPGGWSDGKFYKAEDIISIMKRVPTHEPWDQHENINPTQFTANATDLDLDNRGTGVPGKTVTVEYKASTNVAGTPPTPTGNIEEDNVTAFLWMLRCCEGTSGPDGYRTRFGPKGDNLFAIDDTTLRTYQFKDHPRKGYTYPTKAGSITSTAAGAYQFLSKTWDSCQKALSLPDFSPRSQDLGCIFLLKQAGALTPIKKGDFTTAISRTKRIWASLPGDVYGQGGKNFAQATAFFKQGGGTVNA
jgi:lysozyme